MGLKDRMDPAEIGNRKAIVVRQRERTEPEFCFLACLLNVHVRRLICLMRIEVEAKAVLTKHGGHGLFWSATARAVKPMNACACYGYSSDP